MVPLLIHVILWYYRLLLHVITALRSSNHYAQVIQQKTGSLSYFSDMGFFILMKLYCLEYIFGNEIGCFEFATECTVMFAQ
jgi:hypothetical protein